MANDYVKRQLPTWMRSVELDRDSTRLDALEQAAICLARKLSGRDILDMTLLAYNQAQGDAFDHLRDSVRDRDPTFGCMPDDLESAIAAGAVVAKLLSGDSKAASVTAQGVLSAKWIGLCPAVSELPKLAAATSGRRSEALRQRKRLPKNPVNKDFFSDFLPEATEVDPDEAVRREDFQLLAKAATEMAIKLQTGQHAYAKVLAARLNAADEELEVLWWAYTNYSEFAKKKWGDLAPETAALLCGIELGAKFTFEIELPSTEALLARLLGPDIQATVSLSAAVDGAATLMESMNLPVGHRLLPILSSMSEHSVLQGDPAWKGSVDRWSIDPEHATKKLDFACQAVRETVLMGNISNG